MTKGYGSLSVGDFCLLHHNPENNRFRCDNDINEQQLILASNLTCSFSYEALLSEKTSYIRLVVMWYVSTPFTLYACVLNFHVVMFS